MNNVKILISETSGSVARLGAEEAARRIRTVFGGPEPVFGGAVALKKEALRFASAGGGLVVAAGGDGTLAAIADGLSGSDATLAPLPGGTANVFVQDLGFPADFDDALAAMPNAAPERIDLGEANGRAFVTYVVFGLFAQFADARETLRGADDLNAFILGLGVAADGLNAGDAAPFELTADGVRTEYYTNTLIISNNPFTGPGAFFPRRAALSHGRLEAYAIDAETSLGFFQRFVDFVRTPTEPRDWLSRAGGRVMTVSAGGAPFAYAIDGEPSSATGPVEIGVRPKALQVLRFRGR